MPIKASAKKYMRASARRAARNRIIRGLFRGAIKQTRRAISNGAVDEAQQWMRTSQKALDKAAQKGVIKKNTAARLKHRLNAAVKALALGQKN